VELNTCYFEEMQVVVPTDCFAEERQELAPIAVLNFDHHHTQSEVVVLPIELVPAEEILQTEL